MCRTRHVQRLAIPALVALTLATQTTAAFAGVFPDTPARLWPGGVVPYEFDTNDPPATNSQCCLFAAMDAWEAVANVTFIPRTDEEDYLLIRDGDTGPSYPPPEGYRAGTGGHVLNLDDWCDAVSNCDNCTQVYGLAHEVGHALGLYHTHQRQDRDSHVFINWCVIDDAFSGNYCIGDDSSAWPMNEMDIDSIMSYPLCTFSICKRRVCSGGANDGSSCDVDGDCPDGDCIISPTCPGLPQNCPGGCPDCTGPGSCPSITDQCEMSCSSNPGACAPITLLEPYATIWSGLEFCPGGCGQCDPMDCSLPGIACVGQRNHLSRYDRLLMSFLYPESNWRFVNSFYTGIFVFGTFHLPYKQFVFAEQQMPVGGTMWIVENDTFDADGVYEKAMVIEAPLGAVLE